MSTRLPAFEVLLDMARNDPEGLEALRASLTNAVINSSQSEHNRRRLRGLQFQVDMERERAKTPLAATIRLSELMCQSLAELHRSMVESAESRQRLPTLLGSVEAPGTKDPAPNPTASKCATGGDRPGAQRGARILPFRPL